MFADTRPRICEEFRHNEEGLLSYKGLVSGEGKCGEMSSCERRFAKGVIVGVRVAKTSC